MSTDAVVGCVVIVVSLAVLVYLVLWSRRTINRISRSNSRSAREIGRDLRRGG